MRFKPLDINLNEAQLDKLADFLVQLAVVAYGSTVVSAIVSSHAIPAFEILAGVILGTYFWGLALLVAKEL